MTSREQFETAFRKAYPDIPQSHKDTMLEWWELSREALVVELPEEMKAREALDKGFMCDYAAGVTDTVVQVRENLIAAGIKVKGE